MTSKHRPNGAVKPTYKVEYRKIGKSASLTRLAGRVIVDTFPTSTAFIKARDGRILVSDNRNKRTGIVSGGFIQVTYGR